MIIAGAFLLVIRLWQPQSLASFVPAEGTALFLRNPTENDLQTLGSAFPILRTLPALPAQSEVAVIGERWVASSLVEEHPLPSSNIQIGRQEFLASDPSLEAELNKNTNRLRSSRDFSALMNTVETDARTVYIAKKDDTLLPRAVNVLLRGIAAEDDPLLVTMESGGTVRLRIKSDLSGLAAAPSSLSTLSPAPVVSLTGGNPGAMLSSFLTQNVGIRGLLSARMHEVLGEDWSLEYDVLPLLDSPAQLHLRWNPDGTLRFLLDMEVKSRHAVNLRLAELHDSFRSRLTGATVARRTLEKNLRSAVLQSDPSHVEDATVLKNEWTVRTTGELGGSRVLLSAQRPRRLILSNDTGWMEQITTGTAATPLPARARLLAGGGMDRDLWMPMIAAHTPLWSLASGSSKEAPRLHWTLEEAPGVLTLAIFP